MELACVLRWWLHHYVCQTHITAPFKRLNFIVDKIYPNKDVLNGLLYILNYMHTNLLTLKMFMSMHLS